MLVHTAKPMRPAGMHAELLGFHLPSCLQVRMMDASLQQYVPTDILDTTEGFGYDLDLNDLMVSMPALLLAVAWCFLVWRSVTEWQSGATAC